MNNISRNKGSYGSYRNYGSLIAGIVLVSGVKTVNNQLTTIKVAVIPGDGIGTEVVPEGMRVMQAVSSKLGIHFEWQEFDWSCDTCLKTGRLMPEDGIETLR